MNRLHTLIRSALPVALLLLHAAGVGALQAPGGSLGEQTLRPYWHVFIAYALAIVIVSGWVMSIARRLGDVERRLGADGNAAG